jgi:hypothetical protein
VKLKRNNICSVSLVMFFFALIEKFYVPYKKIITTLIKLELKWVYSLVSHKLNFLSVLLHMFGLF